MKVFYCHDFKGHYPVGTCAIVTANTEEEAKSILLEELEKNGLPQDKEITMTRVRTRKSEVVIVNDGNY